MAGAQRLGGELEISANFATSTVQGVARIDRLPQVDLTGTILATRLQARSDNGIALEGVFSGENARELSGSLRGQVGTQQVEGVFVTTRQP